MSTSVLVIGGSGFIGQALLRALSEAKIETTALIFSNRNQASRIPELAGLKLLMAPSSGVEDLSRSLENHSFSHVVNLAAGGVQPDFRHIDKLTQSNSVLLLNLLQAFAVNPLTLFIHTGSWSEYGPAVPGCPIDESHSILAQSVYGGAKAAATVAGNGFAAANNIPFVTLRLFHVYGPGEPEHRLTPYLITRLSEGNAVELSAGDQIRDYVFVDDVADAYVKVIETDHIEPYKAYNVCSGEPVTVRFVCESVAHELQAPDALLGFSALPPRADEAHEVVGANTRLGLAANWEPRTPLSIGIRKTIDAVQRKVIDG